MSAPALFLDRDGVIQTDLGYVHRPDQVQFVEGIFELVAAANRGGFRVIIVTNQSGIGRGLYSQGQFHEFMRWMIAEFACRGAAVDAVYHCPYHPVAGVGAYRRESEDRKPAPGMLLRAQRDHDLDLARSVLVGDQPSDIEAGKRAGVGTLLYLAPGGLLEGAFTINALHEVLPFLGR
jgi:D-glycero-D-manno-heptose 1,7-bisphosphate phosphatase